MVAAVMASLFLGAVMSLGDVVWATMQLRHRMDYGIAHGAVMCLCLGIAIGLRVGRPLAGALAGPFIGVLAALLFYALIGTIGTDGLSAMFLSWMVFWVLFALLQRQLRPDEGLDRAAIRGVVAAFLSALAFYAISGIWTNPPPGGPNIAVHFLSWSFAFLPGFLVLFWRGARR